MKSIRDVFKIGKGPSSSHTIGPEHAAQEFLRRYPDAELYRVKLYESLCKTGRGHGTDRVLYAVLGDCDWIHAGDDGVISVRDNGATVFKACAGGRHSYTVNGVSDEKLAGYLNALL